MKVTLTDVLVGYEGEPLNITELDENEKITKRPMTWRAIFSNALNTFLQDETPTGETKAKCFALTNKLYKSDEVNLTTSEGALILERVNKIYKGPLVCGHVDQLFNGKPKKGE